MSQSKISHRQHTLTKPEKRPPISSIIILTVITILLIIVFIVIFLSLLRRENSSTKDKIQSEIEILSKDYYENYLYEQLLHAEGLSDQAVFKETMQKYQEYGFSAVRLRQVLLYDHQEDSSRSIFITNYCDENRTYIKFYPEPPFNRTSYRADYTYSCNF